MQIPHAFRLFVLAALFSVLQVSSAQRIPAALGGRNLELGLLRLGDRALISWPDTDIQLTTESVVAGSVLNLSASFAANGIVPDVGAYSLFYELNPQVTKVSAVPPEAKLVLPKVLAGAKIQPLLAGGKYLVVLFMDQDLRNAIADASVNLQKLTDRFDRLPQPRFRSDQEQTKVVNQVDDLAGWYGSVATAGMQRQGPPMNRETLEQLRDEAATLSSLLAPFLDGKENLRPEDISQIDAIHADMDLEIRRHNEAMSGTVPDPDLVECCTVVVNIQGDPKVTSQLRVYYIVNGKFHKPPLAVGLGGSSEFSGLGTGKSEKLRARRYMFWAAKESAPDVMVTHEVLAELKANQPVKEVDLMVMPEFQKSVPNAAGAMTR